jgi:undecaprenyl-diphosphatase
MSLLQVVILALVQGLTELFPISSLGHAVILPDVLRWRLNQGAEWFLPLLVVMHLGTALALLVYFWRDWRDFAFAVLLGRGPKVLEERRLFLRVVAATIPAVILGGLLEKTLKTYAFGLPLVAGVFLVINGIILIVAERMRRPLRRALDDLTVVDALVIGLWQCLALIPGISRSGVTMVGGFRAGLDHQDAARFSFLTATPIILGAAVLEAPKLLKHREVLKGGLGLNDPLKASLLAGAIAGVAAFASLVLIMRWFKTHDIKAFDPFGWYCILAGGLFVAEKLVLG